MEVSKRVSMSGFSPRLPPPSLPPSRPSSPSSSGFIAEKLYYANTTKMCSAPTADEVSKWKSPYILMVDRGDCTFVTKVRFVDPSLPPARPPSLPLSLSFLQPSAR